ncbi:MAG: hypothetical protein ABI574_06830 [Burkholderiales bacterium]
MKRWQTALLACVAATTQWASGHAVVAASAAPDRLADLINRCSDEMQRSVCRAGNDVSQPRSSAAPGSVLFVAGVGAVDSQAYESLRQAGERMCGDVARECAAAWQGGPCKVARALWGSAPKGI